MKKKQLYTWGAEALVTAELPQMLKDAMSATGWNAFGIYDLVKGAVRRDRARARKEKSHNAALTGMFKKREADDSYKLTGLCGLLVLLMVKLETVYYRRMYG